MSAPISDVVQVTVVAAPSPLTQVGFGMPLILSHKAAWAERTRIYSDLAGVGVDFLTTDPEYKAAARVFGQTPRPPSLLIGRSATKPTLGIDVTPIAVDYHVYSFKVNGVTVSFTAGAATTLALIINGLKTALDLLGLALTVTNVGPNTLLRIVANNAGDWFDFNFGPAPDPNLSPVLTHADPATATDLAAIVLERNDWYGLITLFNSPLTVAAAAAWANGAGKLYLPQVIDGAVPNTAPGGGDIAQTMKTAAYGHVAVVFSPAMGDFLDAAELGKCLPFTPGEETWMFKQLSGPQSGSYTATQRSNMKGKNCGFYEPVANRPCTFEGKVASGQFIDFTRYIDYLIARAGERIFNALSTPAKVPYNDRGILLIKNELLGQLEADEAREALIAGSSSVSVPSAANQTNIDRGNRKVSGVQAVTTYAGAIHDVAIQISVLV